MATTDGDLPRLHRYRPRDLHRRRGHPPPPSDLTSPPTSMAPVDGNLLHLLLCGQQDPHRPLSPPSDLTSPPTSMAPTDGNLLHLLLCRQQDPHRPQRPPSPPSDLTSSPTSMAPTDGDHPDPLGYGSHTRNYISYRAGDWLFPVCPPANSVDDDPPPDSIVLDTQAYLDARTNSSTAAVRTAGYHIKVTFWIAHPPRVSYFTVHFPDLPAPAESALSELPKIICTDGDVVLLRVALRLPLYDDYIIYRAGSNKLQVLPPHPTRTCLFSDLEVGLLRCHSMNDRFFVAALSSALPRGHYNLDLYDSNTDTWSTKPMCVEPAQKQIYSFSCPTKVITVGGNSGSIAFVDLSHGILICDVLAGHDTLRYIRLPLLMAPNKMHRDSSFDRDIAISNDTIKYFEMCVYAQPGSLVGTTYISQDWEAAAWKWVGSEKKWHMEYRFKASEIQLVNKSYYRFLPQLLIHHDEDLEMAPILSRLHTGHPALSLHDDGVVYIMAKVDHRDDKACILAVDMRNKTIKGVADFNAERTSSFMLTYLQSKISKHVGKISYRRGKQDAVKTWCEVVRAGKQVAKVT